MKEKAARIIRTATVPPVEALLLLLILYQHQNAAFGDMGDLLLSILFLSVIPVLAYPTAALLSREEDIRGIQRKMAFHFTFIAYLAAMLIGYATRCSELLQAVLDAYFLSALLLVIVNKVFRIKASGHACSCTLPYLILMYYFNWNIVVVIVCVILYAAEFWASIELKRHTVKEFLLGTVIACLIFVRTWWGIIFCM